MIDESSLAIESRRARLAPCAKHADVAGPREGHYPADFAVRIEHQQRLAQPIDVQRGIAEIANESVCRRRDLERRLRTRAADRIDHDFRSGEPGIEQDDLPGDDVV